MKKFWLAVGIVWMIYSLLAIKNPFGIRSIIPNLEPYPDTLQYSLPVWNWLKTGDSRITAFGWNVQRSVPLEYGVFMAPFMWLTKDIRGFYFGNMILGLATIFITMLTVYRLSENSKLKEIFSGLIGFYLATNFYMYTQPQLFMTENLNFLLISLFALLFTFKTNKKTIISGIVLILLTFWLKKSNLPIAGVMIFVFVLKVIFDYWKKDKNTAFKFMVGLSFLSLPFLIYLINDFPPLNGQSYNLNYFKENFAFYINSLSAKPIRYLWYLNPLFTKDIFWLAVFGTCVALTGKKYRWMAMSSLLLIAVYVVAMSIFRDTEGRHMSITLPLILILIVPLLTKIEKLFGKERTKIIVILLLSINLISSPLNNKKIKIITIKEQVGMNLRHAEDPWNYIAINHMNEFLNTLSINDYFATFLPPFYVDLFKEGNFNYLPISKAQGFEKLWRDMGEGKNMVDYYNLLLSEGKNIYVTNYYINNNQDWKKDYIELMSSFENQIVYQSPLDNCNIYKLNLKKSENNSNNPGL